MDFRRKTIDLPQEILHMVIDWTQGNKKTLYSCHAVCRSWSAVARKHLFQNLHLDSYKVEAASAILQHPNSVAPYFRALKMDFGWEYDAALIEKALELLPMLSSVTAFWTDMSYFNTQQDLEDLMIAFLRNIKELIISPHLSSFQDLFKFVSQARSLDLILLHGVNTLKYDQLQPHLFDPPLIQTLGAHSNNVRPLCTWFGSQRRTIIHDLSLRIVDLQPESVADVSHALELLGHTLKDLKLVLISTNGAIAPFQPFNLSQNSGLRAITFNPDHTYSTNLHAWIVATLSTISNSDSPVMEVLHLYCGQLDPCRQADVINLAKIAPLISSSSMALQKIRVRYTLPTESDLEALEVVLQERALELYSAGQITLSCT